MGVFDIGAAEPAFRAWAIAAAHDLGMIRALAEPRTFEELCAVIEVQAGAHRVQALVTALVHAGVLARAADRISLAAMPEAPEVVREGWGKLAEVIRANQPLSMGPDLRGYHEYLFRAGGETARALAPLLPRGSLADLGGGAGAYAAAVLDANPESTVTLVDEPEVIALAREHLAPVSDRVRFVAGDARAAALGAPHGTALLANVLHLHDAPVCAELCAAAVGAVGPGGTVAVLDFDASSPEGVWFAIVMALYTERGRVHPPADIRAWLAAAGLTDLVEHRLSVAPEVVVIAGTRVDVRSARHEQ